jgi:ribose transport system permease protein
MNIWLSCIVAVLACCAVGWFNGFLVVTLKVNSFIATLGTSQVLIAMTLYLSKNQGINNVFSPGFLKTGQSVVFGVPIVFIYLLVIGAVVYYVLEWTRVGRNLFATGANVEAARLSGVRTDRLIYGSFVSSAAVSSLAGILYGAQVGAFSNTFASAYLFPAFAAVFLGATQFSRRPNVWGTVLAVYTLAFGAKGLQLSISDAQYWVGPMFNGVALIIAVALAATRLAGGGGPKKFRRRFSRHAAQDAVEPENQDAHEPSPDGARKEIDRTSA